MEIKQLLDLISQARALMIERGEDPGPIDALKRTVDEGEGLEPDQILCELNRLTGEPVVVRGEALARNVVRFGPVGGVSLAEEWESSSWPELIRNLEGPFAGGEVHFSPEQLEGLADFIRSRDLIKNAPTRTTLRFNHREILRTLLNRPDLGEINSPATLALKYFLFDLLTGMGRKLFPVGESTSLVLLDAWMLDVDTYRSNAWIFVDQEEVLIPSLELAGRSDRTPPVSHVTVFPAGDQDRAKAVESRFGDLVVEGSLHQFVPGLKEITLSTTLRDTEKKGKVYPFGSSGGGSGSLQILEGDDSSPDEEPGDDVDDLEGLLQPSNNSLNETGSLNLIGSPLREPLFMAPTLVPGLTRAGSKPYLPFVP